MRKILPVIRPFSERKGCRGWVVVVTAEFTSSLLFTSGSLLEREGIWGRLRGDLDAPPDLLSHRGPRSPGS